MPVTDPIADFLTRIRNAVKAKKRYVDIPSSNMKVGIAEIMKNAKFIRDYSITEDNKQNVLRILLSYVDEEPSVSGLKRISTPGLRRYVGKDEIPRVLNGLGIAVLSTPNGVINDRQARLQGVGGEVLCYIW
ncbi:MAG: 30S ribosomal protein S8 [Chlorobi bacterium]|nr:30S ribosomal protein S8 [Chlorobiota bacterium]